MYNVFVLAAVAYLVGFAFLWFIRHLDKYDKEPYTKLILLSIFGGLTAVIVTWLLYLKIHPQKSLWDAIFKIGTVEEFSKLITLFILYKFFAKDFDEIVDGIIYVAAISLGFSVIENIFYAVYAPDPYILLFKRFMFATIGHISFSVYMGIAFYIHKKVRRNYAGLLLAYVLAVLGHGLYDGFIFDQHLTVFFIFIYLALLIFQFRLLKVAYAYSKMKKSLSWNNMKLIKSNQMIWDCCRCSGQNNRLFLFQNIKIYQCEHCQHAILKEKDFKKILQYFRPKMSQKKFFKDLKTANLQPSDIFDNTGLYNQTKQRINIPLPYLEQWLKSGNRQDLALYHRHLEGWLFKHLGFKYLIL